MNKTQAVILAAVVALCLLCYHGISKAETRIAQNGPDTVRITLEVCKAEPVLAMIPEQYRNVVRDAHSIIQGKDWHACWFMDGPSVHLLYEDGDQGLVPFAAFKKVPEV